MKKIELSTEKAKELFGKDKVMDELLLANFTKEELTEPKLPESWDEYCEMVGRPDNMADVQFVLPKKYSLSFIYKQQVERKLYLLMKAYNGDWIADWGDSEERKYIIERYNNCIYTYENFKEYHFLAFPTAELRDKFLNNFKDLIEIYFEL